MSDVRCIVCQMKNEFSSALRCCHVAPKYPLFQATGKTIVSSVPTSKGAVITDHVHQPLDLEHPVGGSIFFSCCCMRSIQQQGDRDQRHDYSQKMMMQDGRGL